MEDSPGKASHALGKFFSMRGRTSTNVMETLFTPAKGEIDESMRPANVVDTIYGPTIEPSTKTTIGDAAPLKSANESGLADAKSTSSINGGESHSDLPKLSAAEIFMKNNPIVCNEDLNSQPAHYRVHGTDAKQYAMRALGNVDTLLNRYGYEDTTRRAYQYQQ